MQAQQFYSYLMYLLAGLSMLGAFMLIYTRITPVNEFKLLHQGNAAVSLSFGGATLGFTLAIASSIVHTDRFTAFLIWGACAAVVQLLVYGIASRVIPNLRAELEEGNIAVGGLLGCISLVTGIINAACQSY